MSKVYLVTSGSYSDYSIQGAFSTKAKAQDYLDTLDCYDGGIETWEVDAQDPLLQRVKAGECVYRIQMKRDGSVASCEREQKPSPYTLKQTCEAPCLHLGKWNEKGARLITGRVLAESDQHAIKIMNEHRTRLIAENKWPEGK